MTANWMIDFPLALSAIIFAVAALSVRQIFTGIILYVCLGLVVTIVWARLDAWDVAIAEAAIGAGMTGALLLVAWRKLTPTQSNSQTTKEDSKHEDNSHVS